MAALEARFSAEFEPHESELPRRMLFAIDRTGAAVGTATVWFAEGGERLHWVSVRPEVQGLGIGKAMVLAALRRAELRSGCFLTTQTTSARAIHMYLALGFRPQPLDRVEYAQSERAGWKTVAALLRLPPELFPF